MLNPYDAVVRITSGTETDSSLLSDFAQQLGWQPSDRIQIPSLRYIASTHLVVEHGLRNTAVLTFLQDPYRFRNLTYEQKNSILEVSYNNLVDWHIYIDPTEVVFVYNRREPAEPVVRYDLSRDKWEELRSIKFEQIVGRRKNPNIPSLEDALIKTISQWKRVLPSELDNGATNDQLSALFNAIIFSRAVEDLRRSQRYSMSPDLPEPVTLLQTWRTRGGVLRDVLKTRLDQMLDEIAPGRASQVQSAAFEYDRLQVFDRLDSETVTALLSDFYRSGFSPYQYDFSIISQHALSRIYEHYVSLLRLSTTPEYPQLTLLPQLPEEERNKAFGSIFTPQFVARFFGRFLAERLSPRAFSTLKTCDPACGSGIFLRTLLELQCDPVRRQRSDKDIDACFSNVLGLDIEANARNAAILSLSLLYLILRSDLPDHLNIYANDALEYRHNHREIDQSFDVVIANPPFVRWDTQTPDQRALISAYLGDLATGKPDTYLAFLRLSLDLLKPGGYGLFVLPHSFLFAKSAGKMRRLLAQTCWVRCLADLSSIRVFGDTSVYIILLIFQKRPELSEPEPQATILQCRGNVSQALQEVVEDRKGERDSYTIYDADQATFECDEWVPTQPKEAGLRKRFEQLPCLGEFLAIHLGFTSGQDRIFVLKEQDIPAPDEGLFIPYLRDRDITAYSVPDTTEWYFFYPYEEDRRLTQHDLAVRFPRTWEYLLSHRKSLEFRRTVRSGRYEWWAPAEPRSPSRMIRPKIVTPHLALIPRFGLDVDGRFAVSHSPLLFPKDATVADDLLRFFTAVLNSTPCFWYLASNARKRQREYIELEVMLLKKVRVPDPREVPTVDMVNLIRLVEQRMGASGNEAIRLSQEIDVVVADLYQLTQEEKQAFHMGS